MFGPQSDLHFSRKGCGGWQKETASSQLPQCTPSQTQTRLLSGEAKVPKTVSDLTFTREAAVAAAKKERLALKHPREALQTLPRMPSGCCCDVPKKKLTFSPHKRALAGARPVSALGPESVV